MMLINFKSTVPSRLCAGPGAGPELPSMNVPIIHTNGIEWHGALNVGVGKNQFDLMPFGLMIIS